MVKFQPAFNFMLPREGGHTFTNDGDDPGGATKWGISLRTLAKINDLRFDIDRDGDIDIDDVKSLSRGDAYDFYYRYFFKNTNYNHIVSQTVINKLFDTAVNMGASQATRCMQRAVRATGAYLVSDGKFGPKSLKAINKADPKQLLIAFRSEQAAVYRIIIARKPMLAKYKRGWYRRAYDDNEG